MQRQLLWTPHYAGNDLQPAPSLSDYNWDYHPPISTHTQTETFLIQGKHSWQSFVFKKVATFLLPGHHSLGSYCAPKVPHLPVKCLHKALHPSVFTLSPVKGSSGKKQFIRDSNLQLKVTKKTVSLLGIGCCLWVSLCFLTGCRVRCGAHILHPETQCYLG